MNNIDKTIFNSYETVEAALLNDLATEARTKGKKARVLKGSGYCVKFDGVWYDVTPEQSRISRLICNNCNMFVEHLNAARANFLGFWEAVWGDRLPVIIAHTEKAIEICRKYFEAFKEYIIGGAENNAAEEDVEVTEEKTEETVAAEEAKSEVKNDETAETSNDETEVETEVVAETNTETCACKTHTQGQDQDADDCVCKSHTQRQKPEADGFVCDLHTNPTSRTAPRTTKTVPHDGSLRASKNSS